MSEQNLENEEESIGTTDSDVEEAMLAEEGMELEAGGAGKKTLGLDRWVQLGFVAIALLFVWLFDHIIAAIWYSFADPNEALVTAAAVVVGLLAAMAMYRHKPSHELAYEVADELSRVTWPTRKETSNSTVIVVVTSVITAAILFLFDTVWSAVTDLVYKV